VRHCYRAIASRGACLRPSFRGYSLRLTTEGWLISLRLISLIRNSLEMFFETNRLVAKVLAVVVVSYALLSSQSRSRCSCGGGRDSSKL